jgi:2-keto-4-pentenoate hydratase/2-oxohepta-3-ene-1,7-dioic acid hydratase in catechol pathway
LRLPWVTADGRDRGAYTLEPSKIVCVGRNYRAHAAELGHALPVEPLIFLKPPSAMVPTGARVVRTPGYARIDHEAELGLVIGRRARKVRAADALGHVAGYLAVNDISNRDLQKRDGQFTRAKGFDGFCPIGPRLVEGLDPSALAIRCTVNGVRRQDGNTRDLIFDVPTLIEFISDVMTLEPGDVISTGTPDGVGDLAPGDHVVVEIEGIGALETFMVGGDDA